MPHRLAAWFLILSMLAAPACGPRRDDDDQKEDEKNERKDNRHNIPIIILSGLKLVLKMVTGKK